MRLVKFKEKKCSRKQGSFESSVDIPEDQPTRFAAGRAEELQIRHAAPRTSAYLQIDDACQTRL